jgi:hypothetical protein
MSHLTDTQIAELRKNYSPKFGPKNVDEWMYCSTSSGNPLNNVAAANALLGHILADTLNLQKDVVQEVSKLIDATNQLKTDIEKYRPAKPEDKGKIAGTYDEAVDIIKRLKAQGVEFSSTDQSTIDAAFASRSIPELQGSVWTKWSIALQGRSESLSAQSEQETLRLQTFTNRYTQANDQSSNTQQKDLQGHGNVTRNLGT